VDVFCPAPWAGWHEIGMKKAIDGYRRFVTLLPREPDPGETPERMRLERGSRMA
jgi:hypothetical protein